LPPIPPAVQQPTDNLTPPSDMTVSAMIPEGVTGQTELAPQYVEQPMPMAIPQASQFQTYRPPELRIPQFNPRNIMQQPSVSETLRLPGELKAYEAQTKAQIAAYRANVSAQRNAYNDSINAQVKELNLRKGEADLLKTQLANQYAVGGPSVGTIKIGDKAFGYFATSPTSSKLVPLDPKQSAFEQNLQVKQDAYSNLSRLILSNQNDKAVNAFFALGGRAEDWQVYKSQILASNQPVEQQTETEAPKPKSTGKPTEVLGGKYKVTELK